MSDDKDHFENTDGSDNVNITNNINDQNGLDIHQSVDEQPAPTIIDFIASDQKTLVLILVILFAVLLPTAIIMRKRMFPDKPKPAAKAAVIPEEAPVLPDPKAERELLRSQEYGLDRFQDDKMNRQLDADLEKIKDQEQRMKLDAMQEKLDRDLYR